MKNFIAIILLQRILGPLKILGSNLAAIPNDGKIMMKFKALLSFLFCLTIAALCLSCQNNTSANAAGAKVASGKDIFQQRCVVCHGADGTLGLNGAKDLSKSVMTQEERVNIITHGKNLMTPFNTLLSAEEIQKVADYTLTLKK